ncbi:transcription initiation factor TFIID subunit 3 [Diorhabda carinulata]|uniref:transcription initiation factor TFIID subunit 3 n=1 Tax=Diorhabda carinulata TaxID=1163345 RepID=UPI0025A1FC88|nr:transcription initiation factor TFIID subunit 3 [Diorhabda carinulata]
MSAQFGRDHCKIALVKILQTIGWHSINSTPLEVLTDLLVHYIRQISKTTNDFTTEFGNTEANLDHLGLAFQEMGINLNDLSEYVTYVNFCPPAQPVPKFPLPKEDNLNFLKPGSQEVVTRPVHIHEHMPPMFPLLEEAEIKVEENEIIKNDTIDENVTSSTPQFKKPSEVLPEFRRPKREDEGGRPTREISSVMMTTSGFLSPAREGKLPEAKAPLPPPPPPPVETQPQPPPAPPVSIGGGSVHPASFNEATIKKKMEKREKKMNKELFKPGMEEKIVKKHASMKDVVKMKKKAAAVASNHQSNLSASNLLPNVPLPFFQPPRLSEIKVSPVPPQKIFRETPDKTLAAAKAKTEKFNTTITPIPIKTTNSSVSQMTIQQVEKLFNEPDRKKINILRKISNVKENKSKKENKQSTIVDEGTDIVNKISLSSDITIEPIPMRKGNSPHSTYFDDGSPPGTPTKPRTPDIMLHHHHQHHPNPPLQKEKRKKKEPKPKIKKPRKSQHRPMFTESELMDIIVNRPKTPEAHQMRSQLPPHMGMPAMPFPFLANFGGPGLIPSQLTTPMFPFSHLGGMPNFGKNPYFPSHLPSQMDVSPALQTKVKETKDAKGLPPVLEVKQPPPPLPVPAEVLPQPASIPPPSPPTASIQQQPIQVPETSSSTSILTPRPKTPVPLEIIQKKNKEHKKDKKDKVKKKNKKDKLKDKEEKKKIKDLKKEGKDKVKREKKIKKKDREKLDKEKERLEISENPLIPKILLKVNSPSSRPETPERKLNIKPIVNKDDDDDDNIQIHEKKREPSPGGLAKISALVTGPPKPKNTLSPIPPAEEPPPTLMTPRTPGRPRLHPIKPKSTPKPKKIEQQQQVFKKIDEHGNEVWICPSCSQQDDGRPMIGCDGCDAWYHWVCVGIQVPPDENENWYCKPCLARKNEDFQSDKKKKRKRKEKKEH